MFSSLRLLRVAGIDIKVHATFLLVLVLGATQWTSFGAHGALFGVLSTVLLFVCVLLHELGHSMVAKAYGIPVPTITLMPFGGVAQMAEKPKTPTQELLISLAGPMVNVVLAAGLVAFGVFWLGGEGVLDALRTVGTHRPDATTLFAVLLGSNVMLAVFNMIPALPMDGGRVFRALLSYPLGSYRATKVSSVVGRVIAAAMFAYGLATGQLMLAVIGVFVFFGAAAEMKSEQFGHSLGSVRAGNAVNASALVLGPASTLGEALQATMSTGQSAFAVVHFDRVIGVVGKRDVMEAIQSEGPHGYVAGVMKRSVPQVRADQSLEDARLKMNEALSPAVAVFDGEVFLGLVTEVELARALLPKDGGPRNPPSQWSATVRRSS